MFHTASLATSSFRTAASTSVGALLVGCVLLAAPAAAQCPPVSTYEGFHQENVGAALAAVGEEAIFGHYFGFTVGVFGRRPDDYWTRINSLAGGLAPEALGRAVAWEGDTAVLGDPGDRSQGVPSGAIAVFERVAGALTLETTFLAPDPLTGFFFGETVAVSDDESVILAASTFENGTGAVHVYVRTPAGWVADGDLLPTDLGPSDGFGSGLAAFGGQVFAGAPRHGGKGAVYVFERQASGWTQVDKLVPNLVAAGDAFGAPLEGAGDRLFAGAPGHDPNGKAEAGSVFTLRRVNGNWAQVRRISAAPRRAGTTFGRSIDYDGSRLAVGARGYAYVFHDVGGTWTELTEWTYPDAITYSDFGHAVALYAGGLLVGAPQYDANGFSYPDNTGAVHAYDLGDAGQPFVACGHSVPLLQGGAERLLLDAPASTGQPFLIAGSVTGTGPVSLNGVAVPLTPDAYTNLALASPGLTLPGGVGVLDANGRAQADFVVPPGLPAILVGLDVYHAFVTFDMGGAVVSASNAVAVTLIP